MLFMMSLRGVPDVISCCILFMFFQLLNSYAHTFDTDHKATSFSNTWSVKLKVQGNQSIIDLHRKATSIACSMNMTNHGQVGELTGYYVFASNNSSMSNVAHDDTHWISRQEILRRSKRVSMKQPKFHDPLFRDQWHLHNNRYKIDCNVTGVWNNNIAGRGVVVAVVDDGVQWSHPDLIDNYSPDGSYDLNSDDNDPTPEPDDQDENAHGTRCAGEIAAVPNNHICGVGIAYKAKFSGIRVLDGPMTDTLEATAFNKHFDVNDVYSCSWGPEDDGKTVDGPRLTAQAALKHGIMAGRNGFGSIFVVASGNGGTEGDNCNYDGYATSMYTITIAAVDETGSTPSYAEQCAAMLATTVSSGGSESGRRKIATTNWTLGKKKDQCTKEHSGTSAATPLVAGMIALMLEARPCLTWRDVQYIIVMTATPLYEIPGVQFADRNQWQTNLAGFRHSDYNGFGLLDSWKLVNAARTWQTLPWLTSFKPNCRVNDNEIPNDGKTPLIVETTVSQLECDQHLLQTLEQVLFTVTLSHPSRGDLKFNLVCPSGTSSIIPTRKKDTSDEGLNSWTFSTVKCWGEKPYGTYQLKILDVKQKSGSALGRLKDWQLTLYGSPLTEADILRRKSVIVDSLSGKYISPDSNFTVSCPLGQEALDESEAVSEKTLKLVILLSCAFVVSGIYYSLEMAFCNTEDKTKKDEAEDSQLVSSYNATSTNDAETQESTTDNSLFNPASTHIHDIGNSVPNSVVVEEAIELDSISQYSSNSNTYQVPNFSEISLSYES